MEMIYRNHLILRAGEHHKEIFKCESHIKRENLAATFNLIKF